MEIAKDYHESLKTQVSFISPSRQQTKRHFLDRPTRLLPKPTERKHKDRGRTRGAFAKTNRSHPPNFLLQALPSNTSIISNVCRFSLPSVLTSETARAKRRREEAAARASEEDARKQAEVLRAAKALFSKRTRTLYHWMYPDAPKQQLKMIIADSWEATGAEEKEFYVSQVGGKYSKTESILRRQICVCVTITRW